MTDGIRAYSLRAEYDEATFGSVIAVGPDRASFDVGDAIRKGFGVIVTNHPALIQALDEHPALKHTSAGDAPLAEVPEELGLMAVHVPDTDRKRLDELTPEERDALNRRLENASHPAEHADSHDDSVDTALAAGEPPAPERPALPDNLEQLTRDELLDFADAYDLAVDDGATKSQIVDALRSEVS